VPPNNYYLSKFFPVTFKSQNSLISPISIHLWEGKGREGPDKSYFNTLMCIELTLCKEGGLKKLLWKLVRWKPSDTIAHLKCKLVSGTPTLETQFFGKPVCSTPCYINPAFKDRHGYRCSSWDPVGCSAIEGYWLFVGTYSVGDARSIRENCLGRCSAECLFEWVRFKLPLPLPPFPLHPCMSRSVYLKRSFLTKRS